MSEARYFIMDTEELLRKCIENDRSAWDVFFKRYKRLIYKSVKYKLFKLGICFSRNEALDVVQDIFLFIWEKNKLKEIENPISLKSWLIMISVNHTFNYCRNNKLKRKNEEFSIYDKLAPESPELLIESIVLSNNFDLAETVDLKELYDILKEEISKLNYNQQIALKFSVYNGKKQKDIAEIMHIPEGTVAILISRAKNQLRRKFEPLLRKYEL